MIYPNLVYLSDEARRWWVLNPSSYSILGDYSPTSRYTSAHCHLRPLLRKKPYPVNQALEPIRGIGAVASKAVRNLKEYFYPSSDDLYALLKVFTRLFGCTYFTERQYPRHEIRFDQAR